LHRSASCTADTPARHLDCVNSAIARSLTVMALPLARSLETGAGSPDAPRGALAQLFLGRFLLRLQPRHEYPGSSRDMVAA
jgi:hypothetical protein